MLNAALNLSEYDGCVAKYTYMWHKVKMAVFLFLLFLDIQIEGMYAKILMVLYFIFCGITGPIEVYLKLEICSCIC